MIRLCYTSDTHSYVFPYDFVTGRPEATGYMALSSAFCDDAIIIDCSHGNSRKDFRRQKRVLRSVIDQVIWGDESIKGFMLESNINEGNQPIGPDLKYGVSITDSCIGWEETERILTASAALLREREVGK